MFKHSCQRAENQDVTARDLFLSRFYVTCMRLRSFLRSRSKVLFRIQYTCSIPSRETRPRGSRHFPKNDGTTETPPLPLNSRLDSSLGLRTFAILKPRPCYNGFAGLDQGPSMTQGPTHTFVSIQRRGLGLRFIRSRPVSFHGYPFDAVHTSALRWTAFLTRCGGFGGGRNDLGPRRAGAGRNDPMMRVLTLKSGNSDDRGGVGLITESSALTAATPLTRRKPQPRLEQTFAHLTKESSRCHQQLHIAFHHPWLR